MLILEKLIQLFWSCINYIQEYFNFRRQTYSQQQVELVSIPTLNLEIVKRLNLPVIILIGQSNVRKTQITQNLARIPQNINTQTILKDYNFEFVNFDNKFILVDTPPFDLDDNIDEREKTIKLFQNVFYTLSEQIVAFIIVAKFERTDIIKQNIMKSYKFLHKFQEIIYIMISDFQLSEDQENDKKELEDKLKHFQNQNKSIKSLLFYENNTRNEQKCLIEIQKKFFEIAEKTEMNQLNFSETIMERISEEQSEFMCQEFNKLLQKKKYV